MKRCAECQFLNPGDAIFCEGCGRKLVITLAVSEQRSFFRSGLRRKMELENAPDAYRKGMEAMQVGNLSLAAEILEAAVGEDPDFVPSYAALAEAYQQQGLLDHAVQLCQTAIEADPSSADYHCLLGILMRKLDRLTEAGAAFQKAAALDPEHTAVRNQLAQLSLLQGDYAGTEAWCRQVFQLDPHDPEPHHLLGQAYAGMHRAGEAVLELRRALGLGPFSAENQANIYTLLGDLLADKENWLAAVDEYQKALDADAFHREARRKLKTAQLAAEGARRAGRGRKEL